MKILTLLRHSKTERHSATGRDFDRRLDERGRRDAARMGMELGRLMPGFDLVVSSPAQRAAETAELAGLSPSFDGRIYEASAGDLLAMVQAMDEAVRALLMVGHNPGFERLASRLTGDDIVMPTGSLIEIELPISEWSLAGSSSGRLLRFLKPRELG